MENNVKKVQLRRQAVAKAYNFEKDALSLEIFFDDFKKKTMLTKQNLKKYRIINRLLLLSSQVNKLLTKIRLLTNNDETKHKH